MTNKKFDLALAFLEAQPAVVAGVLEQQSAEDVSRFLCDVPYIYAAPVLEKMLPQHTAKICSLLVPTDCAGLLAEMEISLATAILRHSSPEARKKILSNLPENIKIACKLLLNYSEDSVGGWMVAHVATLPNDCSASDALKRLATEEAAIDTDAIYVVDRERQLQGLISATALLRANPETPITAVMQKKPTILQGRASLISIKTHQGWTSHDTLPVINRNNQLVGMLRHVDLRKGLDQIATTINAPQGGDPISNICEVYGGSLLALFSTVGDMTNIKRH